MRKPNLNSKKTRSEIVDGKVVVYWQKTCPCCNKTFETSSRTQKFCSSECCDKYNKALKLNRKRYDATKSYERLRVRAHGLGVAIMEQLAIDGIVEKKCSCCGSITNLELHHRNLRFFDNTPENLQWLCVNCHHEVHSDIDFTNKGLSNEEIYGESYPLVAPILR